MKENLTEKQFFWSWFWENYGLGIKIIGMMIGFMLYISLAYYLIFFAKEALWGIIIGLVMLFTPLIWMISIPIKWQIQEYKKDKIRYFEKKKGDPK